MAPFKSGKGRNFGKLVQSYKTSSIGQQLRADPPPPFSASGGTTTSAGITPGNGFRYHVFTSDGNFVVDTGEKDIEYLVVGGGGNGGGYYGGGGGAGGVRSNSGGGGGPGGPSPNSEDTYTCTPGTYAVVVGRGGGYPEDIVFSTLMTPMVLVL